MSQMRPRLLFALALVAACGGESTIVQVDVATVNVSPSAAAVEVGLTLQFSAEALDASGGTVSGQPVTWESTNASVASIDGTGLATGLQAGTTQIRATIGGTTGSRTLTVNPSSCTGTPTDVVLTPGQAQVFPGNECLLLPAGAAGDLYRVAIGRPTVVENATNTPSVTLTIAPVVTAVAPLPSEYPAASRSPRRQDFFGRFDGTRAMRHVAMQDATRAFHLELRMRERDLGLRSSAMLRSAAGLARAPIARVDPPSTDSMFLDLSCAATSKKPITLVGFSDNIAVYQETAAHDTLAISAQAANELIGYYDAYIHDMVGDYFGQIPDVNADGRVTIVTTPELETNVAAAVYSGDYFQIGSCPGSNERETIYFQGDLIVALDPPTGDSDYFALGVVAHEMKHVVSLYNSIERGDLMGGPPIFNELWIEEGTAEISQGMSSRVAWAATGGPALGEPITAANILAAVGANGGKETKEMSGVIDVLAGTVRSLSAQPNSVIVDPNDAPSGHSFYASSWHWHNFLGDGYGDASEAMDSAFFRAITDPTTPAGGAAGEIQVTGAADFEELFQEFVLAVSLHGSAFTPAHPIDTWDFVTAGSIFSNPNPPGDYPWPATATETGTGPTRVVTQWAPFAANTYTTKIGPSGVRFHDFRSSGTANAQISVSGSAQPCDANNTQRCDFIMVTRLD